MIRTLKFGKHLRRFAIDNILKNRVLPSELQKTFSEAFNIRTYHQLYDLADSRKVTAVVEETNVAIKLQTSMNVRSFSSATDKANDGIELIVRHDPDEGKFYVEVAGAGSAYIEYERKDELIVLKHTDVPEELGGRGIGKILAKEALNYVAKNDLQLEIQCSFVRKYVCKYEPKYIKYIQK